MMRMKEKGFTLVEIMVGIVVGMVSILAIFQMLSLFEAQRRSTGSAGDMQENGLVALYTLEQDLRMGGYGLIDNGAFACLQVDAYPTLTSLKGSILNAAPALIVDGGSGADIIYTARLDSDVGGIVTGGQRARVIGNYAAGNVPNSIKVDTSAGIKINDYLLVSQANQPCSLFQATALAGNNISVAAIDNPAGSTAVAPNFPGYNVAMAPFVISATGSSTLTTVTTSAAHGLGAIGAMAPIVITNTGTALDNAWQATVLNNTQFTIPASAPVPSPNAGQIATPYASITDIGTPKRDANGVLLPAPNLPNFVNSQFYVDDNAANMTPAHAGTYSLMQSDNYGAPGAVIRSLASNIVMIKAQYGVSSGGQCNNLYGPGPCQQVNCWIDATSPPTPPPSGSSCAPGDWTPQGLLNNVANVSRIKAIRVAIVVRSTAMESAKSGGVCSTTTSAPVSWSDPGITGSSPPPVIDLSSIPNWQCYRYKVYQTIIPLRNVIWARL